MKKESGKLCITKCKELNICKNYKFLFTILFLLLISLLTIFLFNNLTGKAVSGTHQIGPSAEEQSCMMTCMKCSSPGVGCTGNQQECQTKCNVKKSEQSAEEKCVEECALKGCSEFDFSCQEKNKAECDKQCGMIKEPKAKSEEEKCIRDCVNDLQPELICQAGEGGEKGNEICQQCAKQCEYLYTGPCLMEMKLEEKKKACQTCEHCYGKPVLGDSGEGYQCIVDVECKDASSEFGDEPGTGPGIAKQVGDAVNNAVTGIVNFFKGLFRGTEESQEQNSQNEPAISSQESTKNNIQESAEPALS